MGNFNLFGRVGIVLLSILVLSTKAHSDAVILMSRGENEIFTHPSDSPTGTPPRVLFEGKHYTVVKAKIGRKVMSGDVIKTSNAGLLKLGFASGDSLNIGPASALVVDLPNASRQVKEKKGLAPALNLIYGKVRAVISKNGPMKNTEVKTPAAIAGVRGTDFYVEFNPSVGEMITTVFRGAVEVIKPELTKSIVAVVNPGYSHHLKENLEAKPPVLSSKEELREIHEISNVGITKSEFEKLAPAEKALVKKTELACRKAIFEDIKAADPQLAKEIQEKNITSTRAMNAFSLNQVYKKAPRDPERQGKPSEKEMQKIISDDVYEEF